MRQSLLSLFLKNLSEALGTLTRSCPDYDPSIRRNRRR